MIPSVLGLAKLAKMAFDGVDMAPLWQELTTRFASDATDAESCRNMAAALLDMSVIDQMHGNPERGLAFQAQALEMCRLYQIPAALQPTRLTVLGFVIAGKINANTPIEFLIEGTGITLCLLYVVPGKPLPPIPEHDVAIVLVSESEAATPLLLELGRLLSKWPRPVLNRPGQISQVARECLYKRLAPISGVVMSATSRVNREQLGMGLLENGFPLIIRPIDSHAGDGLEKIDGLDELAGYLKRHGEPDFYLSPFQDYRSADGLYRKYRVMLVDGKAFPCHMAISDHWMIHYLNAGMLESMEKRREEEAFMTGFDTGFGRRHGRALAQVADTLGLDYVGIDCAEMPDGRLLVFEAGTALVVHDMDPRDVFPYKHSLMQALFQAFQKLLFRKANFPMS